MITQPTLLPYLSLLTLIKREVSRFLKVLPQTLVAPTINTLLFYMIFALALGGNDRVIRDIPYVVFLAPGLIMMAMAQNAFANTSSSLVIAKVQGNIVDVLMPPLSARDLTVGYVAGGMLRGLAVGLGSWLVLLPFLPLAPIHWPYILGHAFLGCMLLATLGVIGGIWAEKFDHLATITNFIIQPATFLSGTFYTPDMLPEFWRFVCHLNPFFYMIDGFRYGLTGQSDGTLATGWAVMIIGNIVLLTICYRLFKSGYKLRP